MKQQKIHSLDDLVYVIRSDTRRYGRQEKLEDQDRTGKRGSEHTEKKGRSEVKNETSGDRRMLTK
jgi:hypothetical protein